MVGDTDSRVMQKMKDYLYTLNAWQEENFDFINKFANQTFNMTLGLTYNPI